MRQERQQFIQRTVNKLVEQMNKDIYIQNSRFIVDVMKICRQYDVKVYDVELQDNQQGILNPLKKEISVSVKDKVVDKKTNIAMLLSTYILHADKDSDQNIVRYASNAYMPLSEKEIEAEYMSALLLIPHSKVVKEYDIDKLMQIYQVSSYIIELRLQYLGYPIFRQTEHHLKNVKI